MGSRIITENGNYLFQKGQTWFFYNGEWPPAPWVTFCLQAKSRMLPVIKLLLRMDSHSIITCPTSISANSNLITTVCLCDSLSSSPTCIWCPRHNYVKTFLMLFGRIFVFSCWTVDFAWEPESCHFKFHFNFQLLFPNVHLQN